MKPNLSVIKAASVIEALRANPKDLLRIIKQAYLLHDAGETINPNSYFLRYPHKPKDRIIALPAYLGGEFDISGIKWIASCPENITKGLPRASAVIILNDSQTGFPFACMEGSYISATRTAVSAVLAAESILGKNRINRLGIVGTGFIAENILEILRLGNWDIPKITVFDINIARAEAFAEGTKDSKAEISVANSLNALMDCSDVVVFTTTVATPYLDLSNGVRPDHVLLNISLRDIDVDVIFKANNIVDDIEHVLNANTSVDLAFRKHGTHEFINGTLAQLMMGDCMLDSNKPIVFSPMGLGVLDLALGHYVYQYHQQTQSLNVIDNFFII